MSKVYILEYSYPFGGNTNISIWDNDIDAYKQAAHDMQYTIKDSWDMTNIYERDDAREINDRIKCGRYESAIKYFNNCSSNDGDRKEYWYVRAENPQTNACDPQIFADDYFASDDDDDCDCDDKNSIEEVYQATESGATCRGPCGCYNEYAYADKRDGTFICYACKMMNSMFGDKF